MNGRTLSDVHMVDGDAQDADPRRPRSAWDGPWNWLSGGDSERVTRVACLATSLVAVASAPFAAVSLATDFDELPFALGHLLAGAAAWPCCLAYVLARAWLTDKNAHVAATAMLVFTTLHFSVAVALLVCSLG